MKITLDTETLELLDNMITYYDYHKVDKLIETHPHFVIDDFEKLLDILNKLLEKEYVRC